MVPLNFGTPISGLWLRIMSFEHEDPCTTLVFNKDYLNPKPIHLMLNNYTTLNPCTLFKFVSPKLYTHRP